MGAFRIYPMMILLAAIGTYPGGSGQSSERNRFELTPESVPSQAPPREIGLIRWRGESYDLASGIDLLRKTIIDDTIGSDERRLALQELWTARSRLRGHPILDDLTQLYERVGISEKRDVILCLITSKDPRAIPVLTRALDMESDIKIRVSAAAGLAQWNVRRGVAELVRLLDSDDQMPQPSHEFDVRGNALQLFRTKNRLKGWGFPDGEIEEAVMNRPNLNDKERSALFFNE